MWPTHWRRVVHKIVVPVDEFNRWSVRLELHSDNLAGVWALHGQEKFHFTEPRDSGAAITSADAIGDDRIQKLSRGVTSPENYTHGTSQQRVRWFTRGLETADLQTLSSSFEVPYGQL
jgi:predicted metalloprotease